MRRLLRSWSLAGAVAAGAAAGLAGACRGVPNQQPPPRGERPSLRLFVAADVAGALEPCGCRKDMLGGLDHAGAVLAREASEANATLFVGAGPLFSIEPGSPPERRAQDIAKAEAIARGLGQLGLAAWAPAHNDWAFGDEGLRSLFAKSGATPLAANLGGSPATVPTELIDRGGIRVGLAGVSAPLADGKAPAGVTVKPPAAALAQARDALEAARAQLLVALVALPRGEALRLAETTPGFQLMVVGKPAERHATEDAVTPPIRVGQTLVVQAPNHLQGVAVIDVYLGDAGAGRLTLADAEGITNAELTGSLDRRISELERRVAAWEKTPGVARADLDARRGDLERLKAERARVARPGRPEHGGWFTYAVHEVRESAGVHPRVAELITGYTRAVNEQNRVALAGRAPAPSPEGENQYVGEGACAPCHEPAQRFWNDTRHSGAYYTLVSGYAEYNLDCVGCHVTGYEQPGGSTVTHVGQLAAVQCEACHGPGSRHAAEPGTPGLVVRTPPKTLCTESCHHPPHVAPDWNVDEAYKLQIGPGHGLPLDDVLDAPATP